jgi:hypothetical protein
LHPMDHTNPPVSLLRPGIGVIVVVVRSCLQGAAQVFNTSPRNSCVKPHDQREPPEPGIESTYVERCETTGNPQRYNNNEDTYATYQKGAKVFLWLLMYKG